MRVGLVGCGLVGQRRAAAVAETGDDVLVAAADTDVARAGRVATLTGAASTGDWRYVVERADIDAVIVSTTNDCLASITVAALGAGKHVLCEKPLGTSTVEAAAVADQARRSGRILKTGFNHRHHPAIREAHRLSAAGALGPIYFIKGMHGHGGRPGYEHEWRSQREKAGGGDLLDQGVHLFDLCRWFVGDIAEVSSMIATCFWPIAPLEDNAFVLLRARAGQIISLHTSWTYWKNRFEFSVFGRDGFATVEGLGGSYGCERLTIGRRRADHTTPDTSVTEFPGADMSWREEWAEFTAAVREGRQPLGNGEDGYEAVRLVFAAYESAASRHVVPVSTPAVSGAGA